MARENPVGGSNFPKKRMTAALSGLIFTALGFMMEKLFKSVLETALGVAAGLSIILLVLGLFAFFGAWEKREDYHEKNMGALKFQMEEINHKQEINCQSCNFSHQSLLVGLSATHINEIQEQREFYEDYIAAVLYTLDTTVVRAMTAEASILPIVEGLMNSPLFKEYKNNHELMKWRNFLTLIRTDNTQKD
jgi:hypothetical protein